MPLYPMIANYDTESSKDNHAKIWNTKRNHFGWKMYLGGAWDSEVPGYAAVLRTQNLADWPLLPAFCLCREPLFRSAGVKLSETLSDKMTGNQKYPGHFFCD